MWLFDTHVHLLDERFNPDREALISSFDRQGIEAVLEAGTSLKQASELVSFAGTHKKVYAALGTHPHEAAGMENEDIERALPFFANSKVVAVGEIGLDYHYDFSPRDIQKRRFEEQLALAQQLKLPVILHIREASEDALRILRMYQNGLRGVMHCFSGSYETACACLEMGLYIAFGGALTFANAKRQIDIAGKLPIDCVLIETDCPYMTPAPHRGKRNEPAYVRLVCEKLAQIRNMEAEEAAAITLNNAEKLFHITTKADN